MTSAFDVRRLLILAYAVLGMLLLGAPQAQAADIITFGDNANSCGGAVMCSTNGTTGYLNNGTGQAFDLSTINSWFQIDKAGTTSYLAGQLVEPDGGAGGFRVVNDTGAAVTTFSLTITDTFTASTPSVGFCSGSSGPLCDNFQAHGGNANFNTELSGPDWYDCTQGTTVGDTCTGSSGGVAANFTPNMVTYTWSGATIAAGATFDIDFSSFNNDVYATPEPSTLLLLGTGLLGVGRSLKRKLLS